MTRREFLQNAYRAGGLAALFSLGLSFSEAKRIEAGGLIGSGITSGGSVDSYTKSLLHFDGTNGSTTFTDETGKIWTSQDGNPTNGVATIDTGTKKLGTASGYFNGLSGYISTPNHADWSVGAGDWTIDFWFNCALFVGARAIFYHPGMGTYSWCLINVNVDYLQLQISSTGTSWDISGDSCHIGNSLTNNLWYHVAVARSGNNINYFLNGTKIGTLDVTGKTLIDGTGDVYIGSIAGSSGFLFGHVDEFRFSKGIARWTDSFTPPSVPY